MPIFQHTEGRDNLFNDFDRLFLTYYSRLHRFVMDFSFSSEDAEDIVQDIFAKLWERRNEVTIKTNTSSYLLTLTKNKCIDYIRRKSTVEQYKQEASIRLKALQSIPDYQESDRELEEILKKALDALPPRCREIFIKSRFEDLTYKEIAAELGISESTVENQIGIALKRLHVALKDYLPVLLLFGF